MKDPVGATLVVARSTLVVARARPPTPAFAGTERHKGVPYDGVGDVPPTRPSDGVRIQAFRSCASS